MVAGVFNFATRAAAELVLAGWVEVWLGPAGAHRLDHFREHRRGGIVVEVDRVGHRSIIGGGQGGENQRQIVAESGIGSRSAGS